MPIDNKKEQERDELHRAIWAIADELRGAVDGWDFKNYILGTMFYRYISENITNYINTGEIEAGNVDFDFAQMSDEMAEEAREGLVQEKGFFILPSELFCNVRAKAKDDENLNETLERAFRHIEESAKGSESESDFAGLFDDFDVNSNKLGSTVAKRNEKLCKLLDGVADMNLGDVKDHDIDAFGYAYEYLMTMYASNAGKSGGEFFTPADVSELLTRLGTVGKTEINKVYDPACGSATTADAVMQLNAEDGGNRKYIMVQLPEETDEKSEAYKAGYKNICEIGKERIRRAGDKILEENKDKENIDKLDVGFRVLKTDTSNMKDVYYSPENTEQSFLDNLEDNIKEDRTQEDLLFQVMLDLGIPLSSNIEVEQIEDAKVFKVEDRFLVACFDGAISDDVVKQIADMKPFYAVFRDMSMKNDSVAVNFEQIFESVSPETIRKVL